MAATIVINEYNTAGETKEANITNSNMGSDDSPNLVAATYPIAPSGYSYEKWQKLECTNLGGSTIIDNLQIWRTTALSGSDTHETNARTSTYGGAESFVTPIATNSTIATETMPSADPAAANLGIAGSLTGQLTATGESDYLVHQLAIDSGTVAGASCTMNYQYDETA